MAVFCRSCLTIFGAHVCYMYIYTYIGIYMQYKYMFVCIYICVGVGYRVFMLVSVGGLFVRNRALKK